MILKGRIHIKYKCTVDIIIDDLTKLLITIKFDKFINDIGIKKVAGKKKSKALKEVL